MREKLALLMLPVVLGLINWAILEKENHLDKGRSVYVELTPVDPRSVMQGDYMALRFKLANSVRSALLKEKGGDIHTTRLKAADGFAVVKVDEQGIGSFKNIFRGQNLSENETKVHFRVRNHQIKLATNAFYFQEGQGRQFEEARYGQFRVDDAGEILLAGLYDKNLKRLGSP